LEFRAAEALRHENRLAEAEARFLRVVEANPQASWADDAWQRAAQAALDRGDAATAHRLAGQFAARFPQSPLRGDVLLIEARAADMAGEPRVAAEILESLLKPGQQAKGQSGPPLAPAANLIARYELALAYRALGRTADAEDILTRLAQGPSGPITANAQFLLGQAYVEAGRNAEAVTLLDRYLAGNPQGDVAEFALAHLAVAQFGAGREQDAWKTLARLAAQFPQSKALPPARLRIAEAALATHHAEQAANQFRLVAGSNSKKGEPPSGSPNRSGTTIDCSLRVRALAGLGRALGQLGKPAEAAAAFAEALELAPTDPTAPELALARGRTLEAGQKSDAALEAYALTAERFAKSDQGPRAALARARLLVKLGRHTDAAGAFERLLADSHTRESLARSVAPVDALLAEWGWSLIDAAKPAEADRVFSRLLQEYPESPYSADARFNLAESANQARNYPEVIRLLTPLVSKKPVEPSPGSRQGEAPSQAVRAPGAGLQASAGSPRDRLLPAVLYRLARTRVEVQDWAGAVAVLDRLLGEFPENPYRREARFLRAESALQSGDAATAEAGFAALRAEPPGTDDPPGLLRVVRLKQLQCWVALKRWKDLIAAAQSVRAELDANDPAVAEVDYARGQALLGLGRLEEARAAFQAVVDARRGGELAARAQLMRGETFFHQNQLHEALREFLKVDILYDAPRWQAAALLEAGKVYERLDEWADAAETYGRLVERFPGDPNAETAHVRREAASRRAAKGATGRTRPTSG
jgi:TolA-binding protein